VRYFLLLLITSLLLQAQNQEDSIKKMIGHMLIVGFDDQVIRYDSQIVSDIKKYNLGGVILFDKYYATPDRVKNIRSPYQLKNLILQLKKFAKRDIIIAVDQEGGKVARLKPSDGFEAIPSAAQIAKMPLKEVHAIYKKESKTLKNAGINTNFAPVVDLAINPLNHVIVQLERSYSRESQNVVKFAKILIQEQKKEGILSAIKHFPGHGSSLEDSHKGFVDISKTWSSEELKPYKTLIAANMVDMIMTAHVFNAQLDKKYPATLSYKINQELLRDKMGYKGIIISDDLQMKAISKHYSLKEATRLAINAGVDLLLFGNQLAHNSVQKIVENIYQDVQEGKIALSRIKEANKRINQTLTSYQIVQKPINFTKKRIKLTKIYIKEHYGLDVKDIKIVPKNIVIHWTADMSFEKSFERLKGETLFSDRTDIVKASTLNVSAHYLIDRKGIIYQLMPDNWMARHVIGLNYSSIGIENVGGEANKKEDLTDAQLKANIKLIRYLKIKYPTIENIIGHYEYRDFENNQLWLEKDASYRTKKADPGIRFMKKIRQAVDE